MDEYENEHINRALRIINQLIPLADKVERQFKSARGWGIAGLLGGGRFTGFMKHSKLDDVSHEVNQINDLSRQLNNELRNVVVPTDFSSVTNTLTKFADIFFDDIVIGAYVQSKISSTLKQVRRLQRNLKDLKAELYRMKG